MNKLIKNINYLLILALVGFAAVSCEDRVEEITSLDVDRLFSPTDLVAQVTAQTSVRLNWKEVRGATSYSVQVFDYTDETIEGASPVKSMDGVVMADLPLVIAGFEGETSYYVQVQALGGTNINDSKWYGTDFKTDAEQIMFAVNPDELEATQVTLRWPAGEFATHITVQPGDIHYDVTADDIAAGAATITGLTGEVDYVATLMNGTKTRGTQRFTTPMDLGGAIQIFPVDENGVATDIEAIFEAAAAGDIFALMPGEYTVNADITIANNISIKGAKPAERPVIVGAAFKVSNGAAIELRDLILNANPTDSSPERKTVESQMVDYAEDRPDATYGPAIIENCEIMNYVKGLFYVNKIANIESVLIKNNYIHDIECSGGDFVDFRTGIANSVTFVNNTVNNCAAARDLFRMDSGGATNFPGIVSQITITNNTFNAVANNATKRILYIRLGANGPITFTNNIVSNTLGYYTNQSTTVISKLENNNYFNATGPYASATEKAWLDAGTYFLLDPGYDDKFNITNEDLIYYNIGNIK